MVNSTVNSKVYENGRFCVCRSTTGDPIREYYFVSKPNAVLAVPKFRDLVLLLDVVRPHTGSRSLEFVGGRIEADEEPLEAAVRELFEETGFQATRWEAIGSVMPLPSLTTEQVTGFIAHLADDSQNPPVPKLEVSEGILGAEWVSLTSTLELCRNGSIGCSVDAYFALMAIHTF